MRFAAALVFAVVLVNSRIEARLLSTLLWDQDYASALARPACRLQADHPRIAPVEVLSATTHEVLDEMQKALQGVMSSFLDHLRLAKPESVPACSLDGTWQKVSVDGLDPFLDAMGVPWMKRRIAAKASQTQAIKIDGNVRAS